MTGGEARRLLEHRRINSMLIRGEYCYFLLWIDVRSNKTTSDFIFIRHKDNLSLISFMQDSSQ